jgi:hypothetical protein
MTVIHALESRRHHLEMEIGSAGWGLLLIWCGLALFADVGWGVALVGVGVIILGAQALRASVGITAEWFSVAIGVLFLAGGAWELLGIKIGLVPVVCVAAGLLLVASAIRDFVRDQRNPSLR